MLACKGAVLSVLRAVLLDLSSKALLVIRVRLIIALRISWTSRASGDKLIKREAIRTLRINVSLDALRESIELELDVLVRLVSACLKQVRSSS